MNDSAADGNSLMVRLPALPILRILSFREVDRVAGVPKVES
jgi:hypothetical protein